MSRWIVSALGVLTASAIGLSYWAAQERSGRTAAEGRLSRIASELEERTQRLEEIKKVAIELENRRKEAERKAQPCSRLADSKVKVADIELLRENVKPNEETFASLETLDQGGVSYVNNIFLNLLSPPEVKAEVQLICTGELPACTSGSIRVKTGCEEAPQTEECSPATSKKTVRAVMAQVADLVPCMNEVLAPGEMSSLSALTVGTERSAAP